MKILLLGANGQLGATFLADGGLASRGELLAASRNGEPDFGVPGVACDMASTATLLALLDRYQPDIIVNTAAYTAVDKAEADEDAAVAVNGTAVGVLGGWAARRQALVVHYSTDYVFAGDAHQPYAPDAPTAPRSAYGRSKLLGEQALAISGAAHLILRTAWVYSPVGHNFLKTMLRLGAERDELRVVADQSGTPTTTSLIVRGTLAALDTYLSADASQRPSLAGIYHLTAAGQTTWHGFAEAIFEEAVNHGVLTHKPTVTPIATADYPTPASRPAYSVLDNDSFARTFAFALPEWRDELRHTMDALRSRMS